MKHYIFPPLLLLSAVLLAFLAGQSSAFDPPVPRPIERYVLAQFGIAVALTLGIAVLFASAGAMAVLLPCVLLWAMLYTLGLLNERRPYAMRFELARVLLIVPAGALGIVLTGQPPLPSVWLWAGVAGYVAASLAGLQWAAQLKDKTYLNQKVTVDK